MSRETTEERLLVSDPQITEVIDKNSGSILSVEEVVGTNYEEVMKLRFKLREHIEKKEELYICSLCHIPVYLACRKETRHFFFKHEREDGSCPRITRGEMNQKEIDAMRYNGAKESEAHKQLKKFLGESLKLDKRFENIAIEQVWKSKGEWRKPDVSAIFDGKIKIVFEIQLSTTFLNVIVERREFYLKEGGLLCWVFKEIEDKKHKIKLMQDDIFYSNNHNLFTVNEKTHDRSSKEKKFYLECHWIEPIIENQHITDTTWKSEIISFDQLTFDQEQQRIFFFDYDSEKQKLTQQLCRENFEQFWLSNCLNFLYNDNVPQAWKNLEELFSKHKCFLPSLDDIRTDGYTLLNGLYSIKYGKPVGFNFKKLIQVPHHIENSYKLKKLNKKYLKIFLCAPKVYDREKQLDQEDKKKAWANKIERFRPLIKENHEDFKHDNRFDKLICLLFPELADILEKIS